jgi:hypothetical protein
MFRLVRLLTALLAFTLLAANSASAITIVSAEKPASRLFGVFEHRLGVQTFASAGRINEKSALFYDFASDFSVAARGRLERSCRRVHRGSYVSSRSTDRNSTDHSANS